MPEVLKSFSLLSLSAQSPSPIACAFQVAFQFRKTGFLVQNYNVIVLFCSGLIFLFTNIYKSTYAELNMGWEQLLALLCEQS